MSKEEAYLTSVYGPDGEVEQIWSNDNAGFKAYFDKGWSDAPVVASDAPKKRGPKPKVTE